MHYMVYDCFTFFNELELLDIRLHELNDIVDKFVLVEGTVTFTNKKKTLYFENNKKLFKEFEKKIIHVVVKDSPNSSNPWEIERFQFNAIERGLKQAKESDIVLLSCVDEIPKAERVKQNSKKDVSKTKVFLERLYYYYLNYERADNNFWEGTKMLIKKQIIKYKDLYEIRQKEAELKIEDGGWHFSYMGGVKRIQQKIQAFSHQEYNSSKYTSNKHINISIESKKELFGSFVLFRVNNNNLPRYVVNNKEKFSNLLSKKRVNKSENMKIFFQKLLHRLDF
jgi:beta-1,4-mannosyl-glycoprotein beta-1,4-N-acetylglucosaminyltransferase